MGSFPGKIIGAILIFVMLVFGPIVIITLTRGIRTERLTWNAVTYYTDLVRDKGELTVGDYEELVYKLGATMVDYEIVISVQRRLIMPTAGNTYQVRYITAGIWKSENAGVTAPVTLRSGDSIQVVLTPMSQTQTDAMLSSILGLHIARQPISYAATIRNDG